MGRECNASAPQARSASTGPGLRGPEREMHGRKALVALVTLQAKPAAPSGHAPQLPMEGAAPAGEGGGACAGG